MHKLQTQVDFEAAHRLYDVATYSEECRNNVHGHSYKVTFVVGGELNDAGMVIDFKLLKKIIRERIEEPFDHCCILRSSDPLCNDMLKECKKVHIVTDNPTAEWMSKVYFDLVNKALLENNITNCKVIECRVQETEHNIAIYTEE